MELYTALILLGALLAILAAIPFPRAGYLLNAAVVSLAIGMVIFVGAVKV